MGKKQLNKTAERALYQGSALVILRAGTQPSKVELTVACGNAASGVQKGNLKTKRIVLVIK